MVETPFPAQAHANEIERQSLRIVAQTANLARFGREEKEVAARVVHACADPTMADSLILTPGAVTAALHALRADAKVVTDVEMVRRALYVKGALCALDFTRQASWPRTRTELGIERALDAAGEGAIAVIGCAPTALEALITMTAAKRVHLAAVVALPVGYVGAAAAKENLLASGIPAITNRGARGGSAVTAAAFNALVRMANGTYSFEAAGLSAPSSIEEAM